MQELVANDFQNDSVTLSPMGKCAENYQENLRGTCADEWTKGSGGNCVDCETNSFSSILLAGMMIG